jgi:pyruvate dehydrogenase E2 component (dihydrolipoamide acetyltransferase)
VVIAMNVIATPSTRQHAREQGVDLEALARDLGRDEISRADVDGRNGGGGAPAAAQGPTPWDADPAVWGPVEPEPVSRFAQVSAANLTLSQQRIPAVTHHEAADLTALEAFRASLKAEAAARGVKLTGLAFHVRALVRALQDFPRFNASLSADGKTLHLKRHFHIGIAVDTPHGLMVPVIRDADRKGVFAIAAEIVDLAGRAQARKLGPDEMGGASTTITNLGGIGGRGFSPIVNPPEVAILGLTRPRMEPVWTGEDWAPRLTAPIDLSYDHRVINGADAARFCARYAALIEDPRRLLV